MKFLAARVLFILIPQFSMLSYVNTIAKDSSSFLQLKKNIILYYISIKEVFFIPVLLLFILFLPLLNSISLEFHCDIA